ncbi:hypothetical protein ACM7PZ_24985, partial [Pseudomonas aeruginosa]
MSRLVLAGSSVTTVARFMISPPRLHEPVVVIQLVGNTWLKAVFADIADDGAVPFGLFVPVADLDLAFLPGGGGALVPGGGGALV